LTTRREEMLTEMGLTPVWRLRAGTAPVTAVVVEAAEPDVLDAAPAEPTSSHVTRHTSRSPEPERLADVPATAPDSRRATIMRMEWPALKAAVASCLDCTLHAKRNKTVFGVGDENADWMFIGEGPGADEDALGDPFVGQAGKLLDNMLAAIKLTRAENVYIANVVKCRPPGNRNPEPGEAKQCEPFLQRQIELIKPKLIIALGRVAALNLLSRDASIASLRGRVLDYRGTPLIVTYHPAYLLRTLTDKSKAWEDLCFAVKTMEGLQATESAPISQG
jgi:uracil-DNA glycosylase family 4